MKEGKLRVEVVKRRKQLKRAENGEVPERTWCFMEEMGWVDEATEMFDDEAVNYIVTWLDTLDAVAPSGRSGSVLGVRLPEQGRTEHGEGPDSIEEGQEYFEVELGDYERERQRAFADVLARNANYNEQVVSFRRDYLGGRVLTLDQARAFLKSPAARYFVIELFLDLQIPATEHKAEIVGHYERVRDAPNDIDHRVTIRIEPLGITQRIRYARRESPVTDGDQIDVRHCAFKDTGHTVMRTPDEVPLHYRNENGLHEVAHIWPESVLDELRHRSSILAERYHWKEQDMVWFLLTGEPPRLSALTLNVRMSVDNLTTITLSAAPWVSAETIKKNYQNVRSQVLVKGKHALSLRSIAVLRFVERHMRERGARPPWSVLLDLWNHEHPEWTYQGYRGLRQAYHRALDTVAYAPVRFPKWRPSAAQAKKTREALERARDVVELDRSLDDNKQEEI